MHTRRLLSHTLAVALILASCASDQPVTYAGDLTPQAGTCDAPSRAILIKRGRDVQFTPSQGVLVLIGQAAPSGELTASLQTQGADRKPYRLALAATLAGSAIIGTYLTPRCRYAVHLAQAR